MAIRTMLSRRPVVKSRTFLRVMKLEDRTVPIAGYFRIASYNITSSGGSPRTGLDTLLQGISDENYPVNSSTGLPTPESLAEQIDVLAIQEIQNQSTTSQAVVNLLNGIYGAGTYARGSLNGNSTGSGTQGVVYNQLKLQLISETAIGVSSTTGQPRQALRHRFHPVGFTTYAYDFYIYNSHYKAGKSTSGSPTDEERREPEATAIRGDANALGQGANIIFLGDYNVYTSDEVFFQTLLAGGTGQALNGQAFDPIDELGDWSGSSAFKKWFTQAPLNKTPMGSGLTGGGVDDRFDIQLNSGELTDGVHFEYVPNTYHTFGNDGHVAVSGNINDNPTTTNKTVLSDLPNRIQLLDLLTTVSDHLPVVADYRIIPAKVSGTPQINDGSPQRSMITSLKVTFNEQVSLPADLNSAFTLTRQGGGTVTLAGTVTGNSVTLTFANGAIEGKSLMNGRYTLTAVAAQINNGIFDGNGDGIVGDNYTFASALTGPPTNIFRIFGDVDGDGSVAVSDFVVFRQAFNGYLFAFDFDSDGSVSASDFVQFRLWFNTSI